jgi:DNA-binding IclR family transcriptional regulator
LGTKPATTVLKAFKLLELFQHRSRLSVRQAALLVSIPTATAHRLLVSLETAGMIEKAADGHYQLTLRMFELGSLAPLRRLYSEASRIPLQKLSASTGLPVHLAVREERVATFVEVIPGTRYELPTRVGFPAPLHSTAIGKLLLAHGPPELFGFLFSAPLQGFTEFTICDAETLGGELEEMRRTGVSHDRQETHYGRSCTAMPLRIPGHEVQAAISITYSPDDPAESRNSYERLLRIVQHHIEATLIARIGVLPAMPLGVPAWRPAAQPAVSEETLDQMLPPPDIPAA